MKLRTTTYILLGGLALLFSAAGLEAQPGKKRKGGKGHRVFGQQNCAECHSVRSAGIRAKSKNKKLKGPDLTGVAKRNEPAWVGKYIKGEAKKKGKSHTKPFKG